MTHSSQIEAGTGQGLDADQSVLTRTMTMIAGGASLRAILESIVLGVESSIPNVKCSILLLDDAGQHLRHGAAPSLPDFYVKAIDGITIGPGVGCCGTAAYTGKRVVVRDILVDPLWDDFRDLGSRAGLRSCWSEPIFGAGGRLLGTFAMYQTVPAEPSEQHLRAILSTAHLAAIAMERKVAMDALVLSEARAEEATARELASSSILETFFNVSEDLLCVTDCTGKLIRFNRSWESLLGYKAEDLRERTFVELVHPEDLPAMLALRQGMLETGSAVSFVTRFRCADGQYKHIEWRAGPSGDDVHCVGRDVGERIRIEADLRAARADAEHANQAKSDFLANMSHEVRTPLNGVIGIVDALAQTNLSPAQREMIELVQSSGATLERLVSDILDISKIEAGRLDLEIRQFDLRDALSSVLDVARIRADEKGLTFRLDYGDDARGLFDGDSVRIKQILDNLLSNAVKFTKSGGISVRIGATVADNRTLLGIRVEDTGLGFEPAALSSLFDRFSQADTTITRRFGGTGLGLAIVRALIDKMGGTIVAESVPGQGATFILSIPLTRTLSLEDYDETRAQPSPVVEGGSDLQSEPEAPLRVLLAEDNPTNQKVVSMILGPFGAEITTVENGALAVEAFAVGHFDIVLMDMQMPVLDGLAATRALRAFEHDHPERARTPVAMLSANAMEHHKLAAREAGADLHIAKPVTARDLVAGIRQALSLNSEVADSRRA